MQVSLPILHHPKDGYSIDLNRLIDLTRVFKKRDTSSWDRDFCVYIFEDSYKVERYYGMGRYFDLTHYTKSKWLNQSRPFTHKKDLLNNTISSDWTCRIIGYGMTSEEAHVLEAYIILNSKLPLSKIGTKKWDRKSLINKRREKKWEKLMTEYLNLGNGNNSWIIAKRQTNDY
jgi:hypothetical protein